MAGLSSLVGLRREKERARIDIAACRLTDSPFPHTLISGCGGTGKTALAVAVGHELQNHVVVVEGAALKTRPQVITRLLTAHDEATRARKRLLLFIDEVHRLSQPQQEVFYYPMDRDDPRITTVSGETHFPKFTLIAATTRPDILDQASFVSRFINVWRVEPYPLGDLVLIIADWLRHRRMLYTHDVLHAIAERSLGIPRQAIRLTEKAMNRALSRGQRQVFVADCAAVFELEGIDPHGLTELHVRYLKVLATAEGPRGIDGLAGRLGEHKDVILGTVEPALLLFGLIDRTNKGRVITPKGREILTD